MRSTQQDFATPEPITLDVENGAGEITVLCDDSGRSAVTITALDRQSENAVDEMTVELTGAPARLTVHPPRHQRDDASLAIEARIPSGSSVRAVTGSADIGVDGDLRSLLAETGSGDITGRDVSAGAEAKTGSGDITLRDVGAETKLSTGSGDVSVEHVGGRAELSTGSGDLSIATAAALLARTGSGNISAVSVTGEATALAGSGDISVSCAGGPIRVQSGSGDVSLGITRGVVARLDVTTVSGEIHSELDVSDVAPAGDDAAVPVRVQTVSGDIHLRRAEPSTVDGVPVADAAS